MDEDKIIQAILRNREDIEWIKENMSTKADIERLVSIFDGIVKLSEKKDQELTIVTSDMKNHDDRLEKLENDVVTIKPAVGLA